MRELIALLKLADKGSSENVDIMKGKYESEPGMKGIQKQLKNKVAWQNK